MNKQYLRMIEGAVNYAAADRSDPFVYARCLAHLRSGVAGLAGNGEDTFYKADPQSETRFLPNGEPYQAVIYRNIQRP